MAYKRTSVKDGIRTFKCGSADLAQYVCVKQDTDGTVIVATAGTDPIVGITKNKATTTVAASATSLLAPSDNVEVQLRSYNGTILGIAGGTIAVGAYVTASTSGYLVATTSTGDQIVGMYLGSASAAANDIIEILPFTGKY